MWNIPMCLFFCMAMIQYVVGSAPYAIRTCVADHLGAQCTLGPSLGNVQFMDHPVDPAKCAKAHGQAGSVSYASLTLPPGKVLMVEVTTNVAGQSTDRGFFLRPTAITRHWGQALAITKRSATFYVAATGQFSVEFASDAMWRDYASVTTFQALMLFVNPEMSLPTATATVLPPNTNMVDLGPDQTYLFRASNKYDWGKDKVFKLHDNTNVLFEEGAHVRARLVQTEKKINNVQILGYGTLDVHYDLPWDVVGSSDDATRQNIVLLGKNIKVSGITMINTNPKCDNWGYCLNINPNWAPLAQPGDPFDASELQGGGPPFKPRPAHCQLNNMDDSPNLDFTNCPTNHAEGAQISYVKCMTWQMGQDGVNAGKYGQVENSFVRVIDDALKPWDSYGVYKNIVVWTLTLGWPINLGWWQWDQPDVGTVMDSIYVIHNHNWISSKDWPATQSGQCVVGGVYGSGSVKRGYKLSNIFVETAVSCAVGLEISKSAYNRHPTPKGCVGSILDLQIDGMYFDEEFFSYTGGYTNFVSGEAAPNPGCTGNLSGRVENMQIAAAVMGKPLTRSSFVVDATTAPGLTFQTPRALTIPTYQHTPAKNCYAGQGSAREIDLAGVSVPSNDQCIVRCAADASCGCAVYDGQNRECFKRSNCNIASCDSDARFDVYVRPAPTPLPTPPPSSPTPPPSLSCPLLSTPQHGVQVQVDGGVTWYVAFAALPCSVVVSDTSVQLHLCADQTCVYPLAVTTSESVTMEISSWPTPLRIHHTSRASVSRVQLQWVPRHSCAVQQCTALKWSSVKNYQESNGKLNNITYFSGELLDRPCYCDDACPRYKDCCYDYQARCKIGGQILTQSYTGGVPELGTMSQL